MNWYQKSTCIGFLSVVCLSMGIAELCNNDSDFQCHSDKKCIDSALRCNQAFDCDDKSDEQNCDCCSDEKKAKCQSNQFQCLDGTCIDSKRVCNGHKDCSSGDDEVNCLKSETKICRSGQFRCSNGQCIPKSYVCDGTADCSDDEENCLKKNGTCGSHEFTCRDKVRCIRNDQRCNSIIDCADGSDENDCVYRNKQEKCQENQYLCSDGECIDTENLCDGFEDCSSGEDEIESNCPNSETKTCRPGQFKCSNNRCIPANWVCDGTQDCSNDEENCVKLVASNLKQSQNIPCGDNQKDCDQPTKQMKCDRSQFHCSDGKCIDSHSLCNGFKDCTSGEDETNCDRTVGQICAPDQFLCSNNQCIPESWLCDGAQDCSNDEENCDCADGDSSSGCASKKKNACSTFRCPSNAVCQIQSNRPTCICSTGFRYNAKKQTCEDIDECSTFGVCSQGCINTIGSYRCTCVPRFRLASNNQTCRVIGKTGALLLYAASTSINWYALKSNHLKRVARNLNQAIGISYDGEYVYWTNILVEAESLMKAKIDSSDISTLFTAGLSKPTDISVDYITRNIYFTDSDYQHIAVCLNDGRYCKAIITKNVHRPRSIALYPQKGKMYWTDWGASPMIAVASMDGTNNQPLISKDIHWPNGLTLDWPNDRLYWVDARAKSIDSCKLDGSDRRQILENASNHPYGIAVFHDTIFWSDWDSKSIQSCDKFTGKNVKTIIRDETIYDVEVFHAALRPVVKNPCLEGRCSHLCLLNMNNSYTCDCPKKMQLSHDKHTCRSMGKQRDIFMGIGNRLLRLNHQTFGRNAEDNAWTFPFNIDKMTFNSISGDIFVADNQLKAIFHVNLKSNTTKEIITSNIGHIAHMTFDDLANNLYWTDVERSTIEVYSIDTQQRAVVKQFVGLETPIALVAIPEN